jgi:hypothetical protein
MAQAKTKALGLTMEIHGDCFQFSILETLGL